MYNYLINRRNFSSCPNPPLVIAAASEPVEASNGKVIFDPLNSFANETTDTNNYYYKNNSSFTADYRSISSLRDFLLFHFKESYYLLVSVQQQHQKQQEHQLQVHLPTESKNLSASQFLSSLDSLRSFQFEQLVVVLEKNSDLFVTSTFFTTVFLERCKIMGFKEFQERFVELKNINDYESALIVLLVKLCTIGADDYESISYEYLKLLEKIHNNLNKFIFYSCLLVECCLNSVENVLLQSINVISSSSLLVDLSLSRVDVTKIFLGFRFILFSYFKNVSSDSCDMKIVQLSKIYSESTPNYLIFYSMVSEMPLFNGNPWNNNYTKLLKGYSQLLTNDFDSLNESFGNVKFLLFFKCFYCLFQKVLDNFKRFGSELDLTVIKSSTSDLFQFLKDFYSTDSNSLLVYLVAMDDLMVVLELSLILFGRREVEYLVSEILKLLKKFHKFIPEISLDVNAKPLVLSMLEKIHTGLDLIIKHSKLCLSDHLVSVLDFLSSFSFHVSIETIADTQSHLSFSIVYNAITIIFPQAQEISTSEVKVLFKIAQLYHDKNNSTESKEFSRLLSNFISDYSFRIYTGSNDTEMNLLEFYSLARRLFFKYDYLIKCLVHFSLQYSCKDFSNGSSNNSNMQSFLSFAMITVPSVESPLDRMKLYQLIAEVSKNNGMIAVGLDCLKLALFSLNDLECISDTGLIQSLAWSLISYPTYSQELIRGFTKIIKQKRIDCLNSTKEEMFLWISVGLWSCEDYLDYMKSEGKFDGVIAQRNQVWQNESFIWYFRKVLLYLRSFDNKLAAKEGIQYHRILLLLIDVVITRKYFTSTDFVLMELFTMHSNLKDKYKQEYQRKDSEHLQKWIKQIVKKIKVRSELDKSLKQDFNLFYEAIEQEKTYYKELKEHLYREEQ